MSAKKVTKHLREFRVSYTIDLDAESPLEAALKAEEMMKSEDSLRPILIVTDENGKEVSIDLTEQS